MATSVSGLGLPQFSARSTCEDPRFIVRGGVAGFSFGNRETPDPFAPGTAPGERWVWYASGRTARLWSLGDKLAVTPAGSVGIRTTNPAFLLDVAGQAHATSFPASSDARLKTNVKQLTNVLDKLEKIRAVSFQWNELCESLGRSTGRTEIGVIGQEVEAVFPELVTAWGDESYKGVDYGRLSGVLIEAVKELKAQNEVLRSRIEALAGV
jgi:hypothetical protein